MSNDSLRTSNEERERRKRGSCVPGAVALLAVCSAVATVQAQPGTGINDKSLSNLLSPTAQTAAIILNANTLKRIPADSLDRMLVWSDAALTTTAIDHTPVQPGETRVFGEQFGPARASRAMAIAHIAMFDAVNAIKHRYHGYTNLRRSPGASMDAAVVYSMHDALVWLYPSQKSRLDGLLAQDVANLKGDPDSITAGVALGKAAAAAIIALRTNDGAQFPDPQLGTNCDNKPGHCFTPAGRVGAWSQDPISKVTVAVGAYWGIVKPFVIPSVEQFRLPPPPALTSAEYATAFEEVKNFGGDPQHGTPTLRTQTQTFSGKFWSYDGTPALCAPPREYNMVATTVADAISRNHSAEHAISLKDPEELGRYLALVNIAMADAGIVAWESKFFYQNWRPVTAIRSLDQGNDNTIADPTFYPLGGQASNTHGPNFTPPFPAYPSGHATIGGALFQMLRHFTPDETPFVFVSDEWDGKTVDASGNVRPFIPQAFLTLSQAEEENALSRMWLGVHFRFDVERGDVAGRKVADYVFAHTLQPLED